MELISYNIKDWNVIHAIWDKFQGFKISEVDEGFNDYYSRHLQSISTAIVHYPINIVIERFNKAIIWYNSIK